MQSKLAPNQADPHDVFVIEPDVVLAARADATSSAPADNDVKHRLTALAEIASGVSSGKPTPSVDTTFRPADVGDKPVRGDQRGWTSKFAKHVFMALLAICGAAAAAAWPHYEDSAKELITRFVPSFALTSPTSSQMAAASAQPDAPATPAAAQATVTEQPAAQSAPDQATPAPQAPAPDAAATSAAASQMQSMAREIAGMGQQIEQLKASIEQLRTNQEQMSRDIARNADAKASEVRVSAPPNPRARIAAPPRTAAVPLHRPKPAYAASPPPGYRPSPAFLATAPVYPAAPAASSAMPPAAAAPYPPRAQITAEPDGETVVRPPMPLR